MSTTLDEIRDLMAQQLEVIKEIRDLMVRPKAKSMNDKIMMAILMLPETGANMLEISKRVGANRTTMIRSPKWSKFREFFNEFRGKPDFDTANGIDDEGSWSDLRASHRRKGA